MQINHISYSDIQAYTTCPYLYYLNKTQPLYIPGYYSTVGTMLHEILQDYFIDGISILTGPYFEIQFNNHLEKLNEHLELKKQLTDEKNQLISWFVDCVFIFDSHVKQYHNIQLFKQSTEVELYQKLPKWDKYFKGFIDLVFSTESEIEGELVTTYHVNDIKISKKWWDSYKAGRIETKMQLILYKYFLGQELLKEPQPKKIKIETTFLNFQIYNSLEFRTIPFEASKSDVIYVLKTIDNVVNGITKDIFPTVRTSCNFCNRKDTCDKVFK